MSLPVGNPFAKKYLHSRDLARERARKSFYENRPAAAELVDSVNEYVASVALLLSAQDMLAVKFIRFPMYVSSLVVSFTRTHFIAIELTSACELIEATALARKQFELLARLAEIDQFVPGERFVKHPPNVACLRRKSLTKLYGRYSNIAHSMTAHSFGLLDGNERPTMNIKAIYPIFNERAYTTLCDISLSVCEFYEWANLFCSENFQEYDAKWAVTWLTKTTELIRALAPKKAAGK